jgi:hypothetical protein
LFTSAPRVAYNLTAPPTQFTSANFNNKQPPPLRVQRGGVFSISTEAKRDDRQVHVQFTLWGDDLLRFKGQRSRRRGHWRGKKGNSTFSSGKPAQAKIRKSLGNSRMTKEDECNYIKMRLLSEKLEANNAMAEYKKRTSSRMQSAWLLVRLPTRFEWN